MSETTPTTPLAQPEAVAKKPSRVKTFFRTHPRLTKAAKLTGAGAVLVLVTRGVTNAQHNKARLADAKDSLGDAVDAATDSVTLNDTEA